MGTQPPLDETRDVTPSDKPLLDAGSSVGRESMPRITDLSLRERPPVNGSELGAEAETPLGRLDGPAKTEATVPSSSTPRLQLAGEIARGGMGAILKAHDLTLGRDIAVKVLLEAHAGKPEFARRFVEEARIAGQLQHPGIAPVYELGILSDQRPYFTMKLVKGQTLAVLLAARSEPAAELPKFLGIFAQVCQTLAYAHARDVIHRDLKPLNVMVGAFGEVQVMDWGLAKVLTEGGGASEHKPPQGPEVSVICTQRDREAEADSYTQAGSVLGTPAYLAPEQAHGDVELVDERADVFGLGAILCEILTGKPPFVGKGAEATRKAQTAQLEDAYARLDGSGVDGELIALAKRCLAAEPWERPRQAGEVAAALTAYQGAVAERLRKAELARAAEEARAVEARATAAQERKARRMTLALAAAVLLLVLLGGGSWVWLRVEREKRLAETNREVNEALIQAATLREKARTAGGRAALDLAAQARVQAQRAETLASSGGADTAVAAQIQGLLAGLDVDEKDWQQLLESSREDHFQRGNLLFNKGRLDEAVAEYKKALQFDPKFTRAHFYLGFVLARQDKLDEAVAEYKMALQFDSKFLWAHFYLGVALAEQGKLDEAVGQYKMALQLDSTVTSAHFYLSRALAKQGKLEEAIAEGDKILQLDPTHVGAHFLHGRVLGEQGKLDEAIAEYKKAVALGPKNDEAHDWWGEVAQAFARQGRLEEVRVAWQKILEANPPDHSEWFGYAELCLFLGREDEYRRARTALLARFGDATDPIVAERTGRACLLLPATGEELQRAAALADRAASDPKHRYYAYFELAKGLAEYRRDRPEQAIPLLRESALQVTNAMPHLVLALAQYQCGRQEEARQTLTAAIAVYNRDEFREADEVNIWIGHILRREAEERMVPNLSAFLKGQYQPRDSKERLGLIETCRFRKRFLAGARLYVDASATDAKLADDPRNSHRYLAACCAAMAGIGQGEDAVKLDHKERDRWLKQALDWLRADLTAYGKLLDGGKAEERALVRQRLQSWPRDRCLAGIRDKTALEKLPAEARTACGKLWAEFETLSKKAQQG